MFFTQISEAVFSFSADFLTRCFVKKNGWVVGIDKLPQQEKKRKKKMTVFGLGSERRANDVMVRTK